MVHGYAHRIVYEAVRVLERGTGREVVILHEQPSARRILESFEEYATTGGYAVVFLTADDERGPVSGNTGRRRGRPNVIFELGFFFGKLGRNRVVVLLDPNVEKPSEIEGLVYIWLDSRGVWKRTLARELESAGIAVDHSRIP